MNYTNIKLSVVVPVYNEEEAIRAVIENIILFECEILEAFPRLSGIDVLLVNDGSQDQSLEIMQQAIGDLREFAIINHNINRGYGNALKTGFSQASGDIIIFFDGDGTFDFSNTRILLEEFFVSEADMVVGCRFTDVSKMPFIRKAGNKFYAGLIYLLSHENVLDPGSGIRLFKKSILPKILPLPDGLNFIIVMTTKLLFTDLNWRECSVPYHERVGDSKLHVVKDGIRFLRSLLSVMALNNPFQMFFAGTLSALILAIYMGHGPIAHAIDGMLNKDDVFWMIAATFFLNVAVLCYSVGVISTYINRLIFDKKAKKTMFSAYLVNAPIVGHFKHIAFVLLGVAVLFYIGQKINLIPYNWFTLIAITTCGLNGLLLGTTHYTISNIKKHINDRQDQTGFRQEPLPKD